MSTTEGPYADEISPADRLKAIGVDDFPALRRPENIEALAAILREDAEEFARICQHWRNHRVRVKDVDSLVADVKRKAKKPDRGCDATAVPEGIAIIHEGNPLDSARMFLEAFCPHLRQHQGEWLDWNGAGYLPLEDRTVSQRLQGWLEGTATARGDDVRLTWVTPTLVGSVKEMLASEVHAAVDLYEPPCWLDAGLADPPADEVLAFPNGLLHVPTGRFMEPNPRFFTRSPLEFEYNPGAPEPTSWLRFLAEVYEGMESNIDVLQEAMGLMLLADTSHQVIIQRIGPPGCGKGTEIRVITKLAGKRNVASQTLKQLGLTFGLQSMIGKLVLSVTDAYLTKGVSTGEVASAFLRISGEDSITVSRKNLPDWQGRLATRIWVATTRRLLLPDMSGALLRRYVPIVSEVSFADAPDTHLEAKLTAELPGILLWALEGWKRLKARGHFEHSEEGRQVLREIEALANPVAPFVRECCVLGVGTPEEPVRVRTDELLNAFNEWAEECDVGSMFASEFGDRLVMATGGRVKHRRPRTGPMTDSGRKQQPWYYGICLRTAEDG